MALISSGAVAGFSPQTTETPGAPQDAAVLLKLAPVVYPRIAQQASISGDVELILSIQGDGSIRSAMLVSGHPMLRQAALDNARRSKFECRGVCNAGTSYSLKYRFQIVERDPPKDCRATEDPSLPPQQFDVSQHLVTVLAWQMWTCDPSVKIISFRSAKCLYLWRCGRREEAKD